jgi:hypothetical protein
MVEIGAVDKSPLLLTEQHVRLMAEHLPAQCDALCNDEYYICREVDFKMNTAGGYRVVRVSVGKQYIFFKLHELKYLSYILFMVRNKLIRYTEALHDVMTYITSALYSTTYVEPSPTANKTILYYQLYEELKSIVRIIYLNKLILIETVCFFISNPMTSSSFLSINREHDRLQTSFIVLFLPWNTGHKRIQYVYALTTSLLLRIDGVHHQHPL